VTGLAAGLLVLALGGAAQAQVTNNLEPTQLQWNVLGEFGNGMGVRGTANFYAPKLPLFGGITAGWFYGVNSSHLAGERTGAITRFFLGHDVLEVRAGLDLARWFAISLGSHYDHDFVPNADGSTSYKSSRYKSAVPAYGRRGIYAGLKYQRPHKGSRCDDALADDCADLSPVTLILGLSFFYAADVQINTKEHGSLNLKRHRLIELRALYTPADDYARTSLAKQLGGEVRWTYGGMFGITVLISAGWDGDMAMLSLGMGAGAPRSFTGTAPDAATILR
jgi:hypothetical protein